VPFLLT
jgi:hypothetical protein